MADDYRAVNRANWDDRVPAHVASPDYAVEALVDDPSRLSYVVAFDRERLGDLRGLRAAHLQCHIGTDTISLARLGARVTGLDFSPAAVDAATDLARRTGLASGPTAADFVQADVYDAASVLGAGTFDLVYTGIGALCWLPDIDRWAQVVADLLAPGGRLFIREGHPMLFTLDSVDGRLSLQDTYFEREEPVVLDEPGTYVATDRAFTHNVAHEWNHGLGQLVTALLERDFRLTGLVEHDSVPWNALPGFMDHDEATDEWRLADRPWRLAASFTLQAVKG